MPSFRCNEAPISVSDLEKVNVSDKIRDGRASSGSESASARPSYEVGVAPFLLSDEGGRVW